MNRDPSRSNEALLSFSRFVSEGGGIDLFNYQLKPARAILDSIRLGLGLTIVLDFPILSGKDELLAHLETYLMEMFNDGDHTIVVVNWGQEMNLVAVMRLGDRLNSNILTQYRWKMEGFNYSIDRCRTIFYSLDGIFLGKPTPADLLLIVNEAQNIHAMPYDDLDKQLSAGGKITRIICGTKFDNECLMSREIQRALLDEKIDGIQRLFKVSDAEAFLENKFRKDLMTNLSNLYSSGDSELKTMFFGDKRS